MRHPRPPWSPANKAGEHGVRSAGPPPTGSRRIGVCRPEPRRCTAPSPGPSHSPEHPGQPRPWKLDTSDVTTRDITRDCVVRIARIVRARPAPITQSPQHAWPSAFWSTPRHGVLTKVDPVCSGKSGPRTPGGGRHECRRRAKSEPPSQVGKMITLENWASLRHLHLSEDESMRSITQRVEISRSVVAMGRSGPGHRIDDAVTTARPHQTTVRRQGPPGHGRSRL